MFASEQPTALVSAGVVDAKIKDQHRCITKNRWRGVLRWCLIFKIDVLNSWCGRAKSLGLLRTVINRVVLSSTRCRPVDTFRGSF